MKPILAVGFVLLVLTMVQAITVTSPLRTLASEIQLITR